jgi:hypothetical protein
MKNIAVKATLATKEFMSDPFLFRRPDHSLIDKRVLVDCEKMEQTITISFYKYRGYQCSVWIKNTDYRLTGHGKGSSKFKALLSALEIIGIAFDSPLVESTETMEVVMNSIADAMQVTPKRVITHAWVISSYPF